MSSTHTTPSTTTSDEHPRGGAGRAPSNGRGSRTSRRTSGAAVGERTSVAQYILLILLALLFISPLLFMLVTSFKTPNEAAAVPPTWVPENPTTQAYSNVLN